MIPLVSGRRELSSHPHAGNPTGPPGLADGKCFYLGSQQPKGGLEPWVAGGLAKDWPGPSSTHFGRGPTCFLSGLLLREGRASRNRWAAGPVVGTCAFSPGLYLFPSWWSQLLTSLHQEGPLLYQAHFSPAQHARPGALDSMRPECSWAFHDCPGALGHPPGRPGSGEGCT